MRPFERWSSVSAAIAVAVGVRAESWHDRGAEPDARRVRADPGERREARPSPRPRRSTPSRSRGARPPRELDEVRRAAAPASSRAGDRASGPCGTPLLAATGRLVILAAAPPPATGEEREAPWPALAPPRRSCSPPSRLAARARANTFVYVYDRGAVNQVYGFSLAKTGDSLRCRVRPSRRATRSTRLRRPVPDHGERQEERSPLRERRDRASPSGTSARTGRSRPSRARRSATRGRSPASPRCRSGSASSSTPPSPTSTSSTASRCRRTARSSSSPPRR